MRLDVRTVLLLIHPNGREVLLLRRGADKKLFPNLITGIGGKVELERGEGKDLEGAVLRELAEETRIAPEMVRDVRLRLTTQLVRGEEVVVLLWFTGALAAVPTDLASPDGVLAFHDRQKLPVEGMVPTAREAISFVMRLADGDGRTYCGTYGPNQVSLHVSL